jgi:hypothetical protein
MDKPDLPTIAAEIYKLLEPLDRDVRDRALQAALVMLGGSFTPSHEKKSSNEQSEERADGPPLPPKVANWMRTNGLNHEQLNAVFHIDGGICEVLPAEALGKNGKEKTINAYVLAGVAAFLQSGEPRFDDKTARDVCRTMGCFNEGNHAYYLKGKGNVIAGSKDGGWMLTGPGLKLGADLIKYFTNENSK